MIKKCIIFSSCEGGPLVQLAEEWSVREVVSSRLNRNRLVILEIVMDSVPLQEEANPFFYSVTALVTNTVINLKTEDDLGHLSHSCNDFHKYVLKIVSAAQ
jgi:hypothetical protein